MRHYTLSLRWLLPMVFGLGLILTARPVWASEIFDPTVDTCTTLNCGAVTFSGTVIGFAGIAKPFDINVYANPNECLRVALTSGDVNLETVIRAPNGTVFRNDNGFVSPCTNCPIVKINGTPNRGFYLVSIADFAGAPNISNFTLRYGRYNLGNPNCANPTPPS